MSLLANLEKFDEESLGLAQEELDQLKTKERYLREEYTLVTRKIKEVQKSAVNALYTQLQPKIIDALKTISNTDNIDVILSADMIVYSRPSVDITAKVTKCLDQN